MAVSLINKFYLYAYFILTMVTISGVCYPKQSCAEEKAFDEWESYWQDCFDLYTPDFLQSKDNFKAFVVTGHAWQERLNSTKIALNKLIQQSCPEYLKNANGDESLKSFVAEYSFVTKSALKGKQQADSFQEFIRKRFDASSDYLAKYGARMSRMPCGKALSRAHSHINREVGQIETQFITLKKTCPAAAEREVIAKQEQKRRTLASQKRVGTGAPLVKLGATKNTESTLSGLAEDAAKRELGKSKLKQSQ